MKYSIPFYLVILVYLCSCTKEEDIKNDNVFVNTIVSDSDIASVGSILMEDGNLLIAGRLIDNSVPGVLIKINANGKILWKKNASPFNLYLWKVFPLPGTGFATLGIARTGDTYMSVCLYDNNGNYLSKKRINTNYLIYPGQSPFEIIQLSNGNFAVAGSSSNTYGIPVNGYLKILDNEFNLLYSKAFSAPYNYEGFNIQGLSEINNGNIAITAYTSYSCNCDTTASNLILVKTDLTGVVKSFTLLTNWVYNESPNAVASNSNGVFAITSKMTDGIDGNGTIIDYYNRNSISGRIFIDHFNSTGQFTGNVEIVGFPGNGLINSLRKTSDGGSILCGTVNTFNSSYLISQTKIYICKLDVSLHQQWSKVFETANQAIGADALQTTDGGYLVSGHQKSFNDHFEMLMIKTDANGNY